jgi:inorganic pyrophosphatase
MSKSHPINKLRPVEKDGSVNAVIETPKGCRNKFKWDEERGLFMLGGVLPMGAVFPFDFGFIPNTRGQDGDPLDVLLLMDEPAFTGCVLSARLIGVIEAEQRERDGTTERNDRLIAVATEARTDREVQTLEDLSALRLEEIEHFFVSYNQIRGKEFKPLGRFGPNRAQKLLEEGIAAAKK